MMNKQNTNNEPLIEWAEEKNTPIIKIIGVGGGGGNVVAHMYRTGIRDARFLVCNSDSKALDSSPVPDRLQIGAGLGCGGNPEKGREYAEESVEDIKRVLDEKTKMVAYIVRCFMGLAKYNNWEENLLCLAYCTTWLHCDKTLLLCSKCTHDEWLNHWYESHI